MARKVLDMRTNRPAVDEVFSVKIPEDLQIVEIGIIQIISSSNAPISI